MYSSASGNATQGVGCKQQHRDLTLALSYNQRSDTRDTGSSSSPTISPTLVSFRHVSVSSTCERKLWVDLLLPLRFLRVRRLCSRAPYSKRQASSWPSPCPGHGYDPNVAWRTWSGDGSGLANIAAIQVAPNLHGKRNPRNSRLVRSVPASTFLSSAVPTECHSLQCVAQCRVFVSALFRNQDNPRKRIDIHVFSVRVKAHEMLVLFLSSFAAPHLAIPLMTTASEPGNT